MFSFCFLFVFLVVFSCIHFKRIENYSLTSQLQGHRADCAIVLTGGPHRIFDGLKQLYLKKVKKVIISGVNQATQLHQILPEKEGYESLNKDDIILEKDSLTTYGNARQSLPLVKSLNCRNVVLITSQVHMHRAYQTFRSHFPKDIPIYQHSVVVDNPSLSHMAWETLKVVFYDLFLY